MSSPDHCVYITQGNWSRVLKSVDSPNVDYSNVYDRDLTSILSQPELRLLALTKESFANKDFWNTVHLKATQKEDTKTYAFEGGSPAYHRVGNCPTLSSDYTNLVIPVEIKEKGDTEIARFRTFCRQNRHLLESDEGQFMLRLEAQFFLKNPPRTIRRDNTGSLAQSNLNLQEVKERIDRLLIEAGKFMNRDEATRSLINRLGFGTHRCKEAKEEGSTLYIWHYDFKSNLKSYLQTYFRVRFNPELRFYGNLLDELGFVSCSHCHQ